MMKKYIILSLLVISGLASDLLAQARPYRHLMTSEYIQTLYSQNPNLERDMRIANKAVKKMILDLDELDVLYTIPLTFYLVGTAAENTSVSAKIASQIAALNRDYGARPSSISGPGGAGSRYEGMQTAMNLEFCLSIENAGTGIYQQVSAATSWTYDDAIKSEAQGGIDRLHDGSSIGIWVGALNDTVSAYSSLPGVTYAQDGIVIDADYLGWDEAQTTPYNQGKTLTHLIGNYLGLYPLWGLQRCGPDYVMDTPSHNDPNYGCPGGGHISLCSSNPAEMCFNFMDNTDDACMSFFTKGQNRRLRQVLSSMASRKNLISGVTSCGSSFTSDPISSRSDSKSGLHESLKVYPNPTNDIIYLELDLDLPTSVDIKIFNVSGTEVFNKSLGIRSKIKEDIDCSSLNPGIYYIVIKTDLITIASHSITVQ